MIDITPFVAFLIFIAYIVIMYVVFQDDIKTWYRRRKLCKTIGVRVNPNTGGYSPMDGRNEHVLVLVDEVNKLARKSQDLEIKSLHKNALKLIKMYGQTQNDTIHVEVLAQLEMIAELMAKRSRTDNDSLHNQLKINRRYLNHFNDTNNL